MITPLDAFDRKLLMEIQRDAQTPQSELGARVNLSTAAVNRRLKRLADDGVIERYTAVVAPDKVDHPLTIVVNVEVESESIGHDLAWGTAVFSRSVSTPSEQEPAEAVSA